MKQRIKVILPFIVAISVCAGILLGNFFAMNTVSDNRSGAFLGRPANFNKINALLDLIYNKYVDAVDMEAMIEGAIPNILNQLDPHSVYISAADFQSINEGLEGSFSGIGVQFNIQNDTIMVIAVISGGPSERVGILPGDRIVKVNDSLFVGSTVTNESVLLKLRGERDSEVKLGIKRRGTSEILQFNVVRGDIPLNSIDAAYMINDSIAFVRVSKFTMNTHNEFLNAITRLRHEGATHMIVDLRGNPGGSMDAAILMTNEFLPRGSLIVYTQGRTIRRSNTHADGTGSFQNMNLAVLIDEWSASASEIFAGAIQDNDRGTIIGRRSFGKGLVQTQIVFPDNSAVRLTVARYYTPSGRSVQRPYTRGDLSGEYERNIMNRILHGESEGKDGTTMNDSLRHYTIGGRAIYGGGGIMPDIFVPRDTTGISPFYNSLINRSLIYRFSLQYADRNREHLSVHNNWQDLTTYLRTQNLIAGLVEFADEHGVTKNIVGLRRSQGLIQNLLEAYITRIMLGDNDFFAVLNINDIMVQRAIEELKEK